ncbi:MAG: hypothetical protein WB797_10250 [Nocardioides sp.]
MTRPARVLGCALTLAALTGTSGVAVSSAAPARESALHATASTHH